MTLGGSYARVRFAAAPARRWVRATRVRLKPPTISVGPGAGLRFDPGASNPKYASGDAELPVQHALSENMGPGDVLYDIGANVGFFSIVAGRLVGPEGRVYAFEPVPANTRVIRRNIALNDLRNVVVVEKAVDEHSGKADLVLARYAGGAALATAPRPPDATGRISVETTTIDDFVFSGRATPPSLVKIDVEGAEMEVLKGMDATLTTHRPLIVCEIDDAEIDRYEAKYSACVALLTSAGYGITDLEASYPGESWIVGHFLATPLERGRSDLK